MSSEEAAFLKVECLKDAGRGFGSQLMSEEEADRRFGGQRWLPMPRFEIIQASGKKRPIDDGSRFRHNEAAGFKETMRMLHSSAACSACPAACRRRGPRQRHGAAEKLSP